MSIILRPNGAPHHTKMPRPRRTKEQMIAIEAAYAQSDALRAAAWSEANRAIKAGEITGAQYLTMVEEARAAGDKLVREAKGAR